RAGDLRHGPAAGPEFDDPVLTIGQDGPTRGQEDLAQLLTLTLALVVVRAGGALIIQALVLSSTLHALADHVDGAGELATLVGVLGQDAVQVEVAGASLGKQPAADLLRAIVPKARVEVRITP